MSKIYIAGPMSGLKDFNFPAFFEAENQLKSLGYEVVNPAHSDGDTVEAALESAGSAENPNHPWSYYMKRDLPQVMTVDAICLLPGWQDSRGARLEVTVAKALGLPLMVLKDGNLVPRVKIIGLSGWARVGKDTVASRLVGEHGYVRMSFADLIRDALYKLNPSIDVNGYNMPLSSAVDLMGWEELKAESTSIRGLMQRMGTEVGREMFGDSFWVDAAIGSIEDGATIVFADVRYPNEADAIKSLGGEIWRINREGIEPANDHPSETALDDYQFDCIMFNNGTLENTDWCVDDLIAKTPDPLDK